MPSATFLAWLDNEAVDRVVLADVQMAELLRTWTRSTTTRTNPPRLLTDGQGVLGTASDDSFDFTPSATTLLAEFAAAVDRCCVVAVMTNAIPDTFNVIVGGVAATQIGTTFTQGAGASGARISVWRALNPANTTISILLNGVDFSVVGYAFYEGVDATTPIHATVTTLGQASATSSTVTPASATAERVVDFLAVNTGIANPTLVGGAGQTYHQTSPSAGAFFSGGISNEPGAATNTMSWSWTGTGATAQVAIRILPGKEITYSASWPSHIRSSVTPGGVYRRLDSFYENGTALAARATVALVENTPGGYLHNTATETIWVRPTTNGNPGAIDTFDFFGPFFSLFFSNKPKAFDVLYEPRITGEEPHILAEGREPIAGVKAYPVGQLELSNGDGFFDTISREYLWEGHLTTLRVGGGELAFADYEVMATMETAKFPAAGDDRAVLPLRDVSSALLERLPKLTFQDFFGPAGWGTLYTAEYQHHYMPMVWGKVAKAPAYCYENATGAYGTQSKWMIVSPAQTSVGMTVTKVWAEHKTTGAQTILSTSDYTALGYYLLIPFATWPASDYHISVDGSRADLAHTPGTIAKDLLLQVGVPASLIDAASFATADLEAPFDCYIRLPAASTTRVIGECIEDLERSVLGRVYRTATGIWSMAIWSPSTDYAQVPSFLEAELADFQPENDVSEPLAATVRVGFGTQLRTGATFTTQVTMNQTRYGRANASLRHIHTVLANRADAEVMASRFAALSSSPTLRVGATLSPRAITSDVWSRVLLTRRRAPSVIGTFERTLMEIERFTKHLATGRVEVILTDQHGLGDLYRVAAADGVVDWDAASIEDRNQYLYAQDDATERVDSADAATYHRGGEAW